MAKKWTKTKAAKKKAVKKKVAKKKTPKKPSSTLKKTTIVFKCVDSTCTPSTGQKTRIGKKASKVTLSAPECDVTIEFFDPLTGNRILSPFDQPDNPIVLAKGSVIPFTVRAGADSNYGGHYPYRLTCAGCGLIIEPPEMIVP
jgi:hypothetical protein